MLDITLHAPTHMHPHTCTHTLHATHTYRHPNHTYINTCIYTLKHMHTHTHACAYMHALHEHTLTPHTYTHTCIHTYKHIHTYVHTPHKHTWTYPHVHMWSIYRCVRYNSYSNYSSSVRYNDSYINITHIYCLSFTVFIISFTTIAACPENGKYIYNYYWWPH